MVDTCYEPSLSLTRENLKYSVAHLITMSADAHQEIVWLNVPVDEGLAVNVLDASDHLVSQHQDCLDGKPA